MTGLPSSVANAGNLVDAVGVVAVARDEAVELGLHVLAAPGQLVHGVVVGLQLAQRRERFAGGARDGGPPLGDLLGLGIRAAGAVEDLQRAVDGVELLAGVVDGVHAGRALHLEELGGQFAEQAREVVHDLLASGGAVGQLAQHLAHDGVIGPGGQIAAALLGGVEIALEVAVDVVGLARQHAAHVAPLAVADVEVLDRALPVFHLVARLLGLLEKAHGQVLGLGGQPRQLLQPVGVVAILEVAGLGHQLGVLVGARLHDRDVAVLVALQAVQRGAGALVLVDVAGIAIDYFARLAVVALHPIETADQVPDLIDVAVGVAHVAVVGVRLHAGQLGGGVAELRVDLAQVAGAIGRVVGEGRTRGYHDRGRR
jgi:hypothetical protein